MLHSGRFPAGRVVVSQSHIAGARFLGRVGTDRFGRTIAALAERDNEGAGAGAGRYLNLAADGTADNRRQIDHDR